MDPRRDTQRLIHLMTAARRGSLTEAAAELGLTQPALSKSIRALEQSVGMPVLMRSRNGVAVTAAGEALVARGRAIEAELRAAEQELASMRDAGRGHVTIGCGPSEATRLLPAALEQLRRGQPALRISVLYGLNEALMPMVKSGEIEFALSSVPRTAHDPELVHEALHSDRAAVIARAGHPLAGKRNVRPADLAGASWVLARRRELERRALDELFLNAGLKPVEAEVETTSAVLMKTLVMAGDFLTFLPRELIWWEERAGLLRPLAVAAPQWARAVGITRRRSARLGTGAAALAAALRTAAATIARS